MKNKFFEFSFNLLILFFKVINFNKPKVFIYTDSRGFDVIGSSGKNPFKSYIKYFIYNYNSTVFICKEKHTTIPDFLIKIEKYNLNDFKHVILHCGVVDFSPRPISNLEYVLQSKNKNHYFATALDKYSNYYKNPSLIEYQGEPTQNLYSPEFLEDILIPKLKVVKNLIWINSNHFVSGWDGNFTKGRPSNIENTVTIFDTIMQVKIMQTIDLKQWSETEIQSYTIDNIHFTKAGFDAITRLLILKIGK